MPKRFCLTLALLFCAAVFCRAQTDTDLSSELLFSDLDRQTSYVTGGELLRTAVRLHASIIGADAADGEEAYARSAGLWFGEDTRPDLPVTQRTCVMTLRRALSPTALPVVGRLPEAIGVLPDDEAYEAASAFLRAGLLDRPLDPERGITRAEFADILLRIAFPERRSALLPLPEIRTPRSPYELCCTPSLDNGNWGISSGWQADLRASAPLAADTGYNTVSDVRADASSRLVRYFNTIADDRIELRTGIVVTYGFNGIRLEFLDEDGAPVFRLFTENNTFCAENADGEPPAVLQTAGRNGLYTFRFVLDLEKSAAQVFINNRDCGSYPLCGDRVGAFALSTSDGTLNRFVVNGGVYARANYAIWEDLTQTESVPCDMRRSGEVTVNAGALRFEGGSSVFRSFEPLDGTVAFALNTLIASDGEAVFSLYCEDAPVVTVTASGGSLYANGTYLCPYSADLWQKLRVEADTLAQNAVVKVNAKTRATVDFACDAPYVNGITIADGGTSAVSVDDVAVFNIVDYDVPEPVVPSGADDYTLGVNVCSLWRNGESIGWNVITPYDDIRPVLGYYDEGSPETADWENKFMAEHGVDFAAFCWFANQTNAPLKKTPNSAALDDGYLYSRYSDRVSFSLIWEASNGALPANSAAFRRYYVPYLIENYFSDERYMKIDGKLPLSIFGADDLCDVFSARGMNVRTELDHLRSAVKSATGCDMIILACGYCTDSLSSRGFDGWHTYSWGTDGSSLAVNKSENLSARRAKDVTVVPSVSVGFNSVAWHGKRYPLITVADFKTANEWVRDTYLPSYAARDGVVWNDRLVWLSTWNEYGEGTYIMPCEGLHGFGYLDALREVYTTGGAHADAVPTDEQRARINHLYPQDLVRIAPYGNFTDNYDVGVTLTVDGHTLENALPGVIDADGTVYFPFEPHASRIWQYLFVDYRWDPTVGRLTLRRDGKSYIFTAGSSVCRVGNDLIPLGGTVYTMDRVPMLPIRGLARALGFTCADGAANDWYIATPQAQTAHRNNDEAANGTWDFTSPGEMHRFTTYSSVPSHTPDGLHLECDNADPSLSTSTAAFSLAAYTTVQVKMRAGIASDSTAGVYFTTTGASGFSEDRAVRLPVRASDNGVWQTYDFRMADNAAWNGMLASLRFDPFECAGTVDIAYIRLLRDGESEMPLYKQYLPVRNGDSSGEESGFVSNNASVTLTEDGDGMRFHRFLPRTDDKIWCYALQRQTFAAGHTYGIDFDVRLVSLGTDTAADFTDSVNVWCNMQYAGADHMLTALAVTKTDGWRHYHAICTVSASATDRTGDVFSVFTVPVGDKGVGFDLDNVVIKDITYNH